MKGGGGRKRAEKGKGESCDPPEREVWLCHCSWLITMIDIELRDLRNFVFNCWLWFNPPRSTWACCLSSSSAVYTHQPLLLSLGLERYWYWVIGYWAIFTYWRPATDDRPTTDLRAYLSWNWSLPSSVKSGPNLMPKLSVVYPIKQE